jgi:hypothetical protein
MKNIFIVIIGLSTFLLADFSRNGEIVTDNITTLEWQDNSDANTTTENWVDAIVYCEGLILGSFDDWRMPNINELLSIADKNKATAPAISNVFKYVAYTPNNLTLYTVLYWSSTTSLDNIFHKEDRAYSVSFNYGDEVDTFVHTKKSNSNHIRCVRGGQ